MRLLHLDGIVFSQAEMLVLMNALQPDDLIGIDSDALIPADRETHQALILAGMQQLIDRDLLVIKDGVHVLNRDLLAMAGVVAYPQIVTILLKDVPEVGQQQFTYYMSDQLIVEHTMPAAQQYRLATIPDLRAQMERMVAILPVQQQVSRPGYDFTVPQDIFFRARERVLAGELGQADDALIAAGVGAESSQALLQAMAQPLFSGTVAYMAAEPPRVVDARNMAVLQGQDSAWAVFPVSAGQFQVWTVAGDTLLERLLDEWQELAASRVEGGL